MQRRPTPRPVLNGIALSDPGEAARQHLQSILSYKGAAETHALMIGQALAGHSAYR